MRETVIELGVEAYGMFGRKKPPPEQMVHLRIIEDAIDSYLCGVYSDKIDYFDEREHHRAADFIFKTDGIFSFEYHWDLAFPYIDISIQSIRKVLNENFRQRYKQWRKNGKNNGDGRRERDSDVGDNGEHTRSSVGSPAGKRVECILFGPGP